ncbi:hypothetical protein BTJ68_01198 [Hortaea werneckii EXF-2000]|uniref:Uncharacterized protein n=1 Tax=Hortaea werneckii EXF-2000 TaxID=1157616 RepID=A0A1Z5TRY5_HORWE|nr:hypothetical protein BTJ68_01198 [Hortaea werneckii EXF-2000]
MAAIQLNFTLRTSANCKTVHLLGSWDNYNGQLPLSKDSSKTGGWKGTFRFQGSTLKQGQRYWYYYIIDGYHLNVLNIPAAKSAEAAPTKSSRHSRRVSAAVPNGRSLSPSQIKSPKPMRPTETSQIRGEAFAHATVEQLTRKFATAELSDDSSSEEDDSEDDSDVESDVPSLSSRSSNSSTPSSVSSTSSCCTCERYGITRAGSRVKLDCGGSRCGYSDSSECSSDSEEEVCTRSARRHGIVVRK